MKPTHLLALDQGTSSSRSIVFDAHGRILAMAQAEFRQIYPRPGWVEHDPKEILESQLATARAALEMLSTSRDNRAPSQRAMSTVMPVAAKNSPEKTLKRKTRSSSTVWRVRA